MTRAKGFPVYEVFNSFCKIPTWETGHPLDVDRFRAALSEVVHLPGFSPEVMGDYIQANHVEPIWPKSDAHLKQVILGLIEEATSERRRIRSYRR